MDAITINQAKQNIDGVIEQVIADAEPTIICDDKGQKVVNFPPAKRNPLSSVLAQPAL